MIDNNSIEILKLLDDLLAWSIDKSELSTDIANRYFKEYVAWKIPFPMELIDSESNNVGLRAFCIERLITKLVSLTEVAKKLETTNDLVRTYCLISEPNLFASEVGVVFTEEKWNSLLYRDIKTDSFYEKTEVDEKKLGSQ